MVKTEITEQSIQDSLDHKDYGLALSGAFSYLDGALGCTIGKHSKSIKNAIKENKKTFTHAMTGGIIIGEIKLLYTKLTPIEEILYDIRCNIQHDGIVNIVEITDEPKIAVYPDRIELPLGIIQGLIAVANAIKRSNCP